MDIEVERNKQLKQLKDQILGEPDTTGKDKFVVFSTEAGIGKTNTLIDAMVEQFQREQKVKSLIITRLNSEGERIANSINRKVREDIAAAWNSDKHEAITDVSKKATVLVISHEKYKYLNKQSLQRAFITAKRSNLIIDEQLNCTDTRLFGLKDIVKISDTLDEIPKFKKTFSNLTNNWHAFLLENSNNRKAELLEIWDLSMEDFFTEFSKEIFNYPFPQDFFQGKAIKSKEDLVDQFDPFLKLYNNPVIIVGDKVILNYSLTNMFTLDNNIILDASARMNCAYKLNPKFEVVKRKIILDYSKWTLHWFKDNTSKSKKNRIKDFVIKIAKFIKQNINKKDKALIINNLKETGRLKKELEQFQYYENLSFTNFTDMTGKNNWGECNKCFILQTPILPPINYVVAYNTITGVPLTNNDLIYKGTGESIRFDNSKIQQLMDDNIACNLYQGIKRINRNNNLETEIYLLCNRTKVVEKVISNLPNIIVRHENNLFEKKKYNTQNRPSQYDEKYLEILKEGISERNNNQKEVVKSKKEITENLGIKSQNLSKVIIRNKEFMEANNIISKGQKIIFIWD